MANRQELSVAQYLQWVGQLFLEKETWRKSFNIAYDDLMSAKASQLSEKLDRLEILNDVSPEIRRLREERDEARQWARDLYHGRRPPKDVTFMGGEGWGQSYAKGPSLVEFLTEKDLPEVPDGHVWWDPNVECPCGDPDCT